MICASDGQSIRIARLYTQETYLGLMLGTREDSTRLMLEDPKACFVPEKWQRYEFSILGLKNDSYELPPVVVIALLAKENQDGSDAVQVAAWFQNEFFQPPSEEILKLVSELSWPSTTAAGDSFYS